MDEKIRSNNKQFYFTSSLCLHFLSWRSNWVSKISVMQGPSIVISLARGSYHITPFNMSPIESSNG